MSLWQRSVQTYHRMMASLWGERLFGRALPSAFFLVGFLGGLPHFPDLRAVWDDPAPGALLLVAHEALSRSLGLWLAVLFAIRKPVLGRRSSLSGAIVALAATYYGAFAIFFNTLGVRTPSPTDDPMLSAVGVVLGMAATLLLLVSYTSLGRHIGVFPEVRGLVTDGPYRIFRHPIYVAYLLGALGALARTLSLETLGLLLGYYVLVAWRARLEERALEEHFGEAYRSYRARTLGLPLPWRIGGGRTAAQITSIASPKL